MTEREGSFLKVGDVVQLGPETGNMAFRYCFMIISEMKSFGAQGYVQALGTREEIGGQAYYRANWKDMEYVGKAVWAIGSTANGF